MITKNAEIPLEERRQIFHETYGEDLDAGWSLVSLVKGCGFFLAKIVGEEKAVQGMAKVVGALGSASTNSIAEWAEDLDDMGTNAFSEWPLGQKLHDLTAYAIFGFVFCDDRDPTKRRQYLESLIDEVKDFLDQSTRWLSADDFGDSTGSELDRLVTLATNRWALDNNEPIEPRALAFFGGITEGTVRNMMSGSNATFKNVEGRVAATDAKYWLGERKEFWNSIWEQSPAVEDAEQPTEKLEPVFVPVARDGSIFHPGLKRPSGFIIGKKGNELHIDSFEEALASLHTMPIPYWRRPNAKGVPGIVKGMRWVRVDNNLLRQAGSTPNFQLPESFK